MADFPIVILQDRYSGTYSGGRWLAVDGATEIFKDGPTRIEFCLSGDDGPSGPDTEAGLFWVDPPKWIAADKTPDEALLKLRNASK